MRKKYIHVVVLFVLVLLLGIWVFFRLQETTDYGVDFNVSELKQELTDLAFLRYTPPNVVYYNQNMINWRLDDRMSDFVFWQIFGNADPKLYLVVYEQAQEFQHHFTAFGHARYQSDGRHRLLVTFSIYNSMSRSRTRADLEFIISDAGYIEHLEIRSS